MLCRKTLPSLILRFINYSSRRHELLCLLDGNSKDGDHSWTYLFSD